MAIVRPTYRPCGKTLNFTDCLWSVTANVQSRPSDCGPRYGGRTCAGAEANARKIRYLLEHGSSSKRTCVARTILFLPFGRTEFVGSIALHRTESIESRFGREAGVLVLVERC